MLAALGGYSKAVAALLRYGADANAVTRDNGSTALMGAAVGGHAECVTRLLVGGAAVNATTNGTASTALMFASAGGHTSVAKQLVRAMLEENTGELVLEPLPIGGLIANNLDVNKGPAAIVEAVALANRRLADTAMASTEGPLPD